MRSSSAKIALCLSVLLTLILSPMTAPPTFAQGGLATADLVSGTLTPEDLANTLLASDSGISIVPGSVHFTGALVAAGTFTGGDGIIGFDSGIILSSGNVANVLGPNLQDGITGENSQPGYQPLTDIAGFTTYDAAILEFDFIPQGDSISFIYVFSSDEYNEYANGIVNDAFAFMVNDVNYAQITTVAGVTVPVTINTVNGGKPYGTNAQNPEYFRNNDPTDGGPFLNTEMDGLTTVLTVQAPVSPAIMNHVTIAIADAGDGALDSNVFIKQRSFTDRAADVSLMMDVSDRAPEVSDTITINLTVSNDGPYDTNELKVAAPVATGLELVSAAPSWGSYSMGVWDVGALASGTTATLALGATVTTADPIEVVAQVIESDRLDPDSTPNNYVVGEDDHKVVRLNAVNTAPTDISLSSNQVQENSENGTPIGYLVATDPDAGDSHQFVLVNDAEGRFALDNNRLEVADGSLLDYEVETSHTIRVRATDSAEATFEKDFTIVVTDVEENSAPTDISLDSTSIPENQAPGTPVGALSTTDPNSDDTHTYTLVAGEGDDDNASFTIDGASLKAAVSFDHETRDTYSIRVRTTDAGGLYHEEALAISIGDLNEAPTGLALSATSVPEDVAVNSTVGTLSATDPDSGDTHTYTLVSGEGDSDNASFTIDGTTLKTAVLLDYETKSAYSVRVRATDAEGLHYEQAFAISVTDANEAPTDITLSNGGVAENLEAGATVGAFSTTDQDVGDVHSYALVAGDGDTDNPAFTIVGASLRTASSFDYEAMSVYSIRVLVTDSGGLTYDEAFTITVTDVNDPVSGITLSSASVNENLEAGAPVGAFSSTDPDSGDSHVYALVDGDGADDNGSFLIDGSVLKTAAPFDFETKDTYGIRVRSTDSGGLEIEEQFTISISDVNESPTDVSFSDSSVAEDVAVDTTVGTFSTSDPDAGDAHTYSLVAGEGDTDNALFTVNGNALRTATTLDFETQASYSVRILATDTGGLTIEKAFSISVTDVNEAPTGLSLDNLSVDEELAGALVGTLSATDPDTGDTHTFALVDGDGDDDNGYFSVDSSQVITGVQLDYETRDTYSIRVSAQDSGGLTYETTFSIQVLDVNDPPVAADDSLAVAEDGTVDVDLAANDHDADRHALTITELGTPSYGTVAQTGDTTVRYTPGPNFHGHDSFTYTVSDGNGGLASATVSVTVTPVNDAPAAHGDTASTLRDTAVTIDVLANDSDVDGDSLAVQSAGTPQHGTAEPTSGGIRYTPATGYVGADSFAYVVSDGAGGTASALVTVTVALPPAASRPGSLTGTVFNDRNGNGLPDDSEPPLPGVTISISATGPDGILGTRDDTLVATVTTGADGTYRLDGLDAGRYLVVQTQPDRYTSSTPNTVPVDVPPDGVAQANFGEQGIGAITGVVYEDRNGNGRQDDGEPGLQSVVVTLYAAGPDGRLGTGDDSVLATVTTGADGTYALTDVAAGSYRVVETDPSGYVSSTRNDVTVTIVTGGAACAAFGDRAVGTVAGTVYEDSNGNGRQDVGEVGLPGVSVALHGAGADGLVGSGDDVDAGTTNTDASGAYAFTSLVPGRYLVRETDADGYASTTSNAVPISLASGGAASAHFGDRQLGTISGRLFSDLNGSGSWDAGEEGLAGVQVRLFTAGPDARLGSIDDVQAGATTTDSQGRYTFGDLAAGNYLVRATSPQGYVMNSDNPVAVAITDGASAAADFALQPEGTLLGSVFDDLNGNGRRDPGEPGLGGVTVQLQSGQGLAAQATALATAVTAGNGAYVFTGIQPGSYVLQSSLPAGYAASGGDSAPVTVSAGGAGSADLAGMIQRSVRGSVFNDLDGDGDQGPSESGLSGATVELVDCGADEVCGTDDDSVAATGTTDDEGRYSFLDVAPGQYVVRQVELDGYSAGNSSAPVTMTSGGAAGASFGQQALGTIGGVVYDDANQNRRRDAGERGIGGVTITLHGPEGASQATTSGDGAYLFTGLEDGTYVVEETDLAGYASTTPNRVSVSLEGDAGRALFGDLSPLHAATREEQVFLPTFRQGMVGGVEEQRR